VSLLEARLCAAPIAGTFQPEKLMENYTRVSLGCKKLKNLLPFVFYYAFMKPIAG
jgi:hypothetical protein